jgi:Exostosin family
MVALAVRDRFGVHQTVASPDAADLILFVEHSTDAGAYFQAVRRHPLYKRFRERCFLFCSTDRVIPFLPGVFASIERSWHRPAWTRSGAYLNVDPSTPATLRTPSPPTHLFSFIGTPNSAPVRKRILELRHPRALIRNTAAASQNALTHEEYLEAVLDSSFVLCPRGGGTSSLRLFETMALGRTPVIVSDEWTPPTGPDWPSFSLRVAESEVARIPAFLEERESEAEQLGRRAEEAFLAWFAPDVLFHRVIEWCLEIQAAALDRSVFMPLYPYVQLLRPYHTLRWAARSLGHGSWRVPAPIYKLLRVPTR